MEILFNNKVAVVIGGTRGIGLRCSEMLAEGGAKVAIVGHNPQNLKKALVTTGKYGEAKGYILDVNDTPRINTVVRKIIDDMGRIDILVCSSGVSMKPPKPAHEITEEEWDRIIHTNLKSMFFVNQAVARLAMIPQKSGVIVNISSQASLATIANNSPYAVSKSGVNQLTRNEALEWAAYNIRVNAVAPTWVLTELVKPVFAADSIFEANELSRIPLKRFDTVDDVAQAICFLASDQAGMITGTVLSVDGGRTL